MAIIGQKRRGFGIGQKLPQQIAEVGNKIYSGFRDGMIYELTYQKRKLNDFPSE